MGLKNKKVGLKSTFQTNPNSYTLSHWMLLIFKRMEHNFLKWSQTVDVFSWFCYLFFLRGKEKERKRENLLF